jgi:hypothetical protein
LAQKISREQLIALLRLHGESDAHDVKETADLKGKPARAELARDVLAFMNTEDSGHIVFGVEDKTYAPIGLTNEIDLDTTTVYKALTTYIDGALPLMSATYVVSDQEIGIAGWSAPRLIEGVERFDVNLNTRR